MLVAAFIRREQAVACGGAWMWGLGARLSAVRPVLLYRGLVKDRPLVFAVSEAPCSARDAAGNQEEQSSTPSNFAKI